MGSGWGSGEVEVGGEQYLWKGEEIREVGTSIALGNILRNL